MALFNTWLKQSILAVILAFYLICNLNLAFSASGGVMGGSSFHSDSDSDTNSNSNLYNSLDDNAASRYNGTLTHGDEKSDLWGLFVFMGGVVLVFFVRIVFFPRQIEGKSVLMIQVGLLGKARFIQRDINQIALTADTSTVKGFYYILKKTISSLLQHQDYCISGYSFVDQTSSMESLEEHFNKISHRERGKFDMETLVNVDNVKVQRTCVSKVNKLGNEYIVVTILVAAIGAHKLSAIKDSKSLTEALQYLDSIHGSKIKAVHVLWTPQNDKDTLVEEELLENYPRLRPILESALDPSI